MSDRPLAEVQTIYEYLLEEARRVRRRTVRRMRALRRRFPADPAGDRTRLDRRTWLDGPHSAAPADGQADPSA